MSCIHFKTAFKVNYDKVTFDGTSISIGQLKKLIAEKLKFSKQVDYDLEITNAETEQVYQNENDTIIKNSRVHVKRNLKTSTAPMRAQPAKVSNTPPVVSNPVTPAAPPVVVPVSVPQIPAPVKPSIVPTISIPKTTHDSLAPLDIPSNPIVYVEETSRPHIEIESDRRKDEQDKLSSILINQMTKMAPDQALTNKFLGINRPVVRPQLGINLADRPVPPGYLCTICRKPGHFKQFCPEAGILPRPDERPKFPSGIPKTNLIPAQPGNKFAMLGPEGYVMTQLDQEAAKNVKKDKIMFDDEDIDAKKTDKIEQNEAIKQIPPELRCPFGGHLIKDAVLVPCCGHFVCCDECIKRKMSNDEPIECPYEKCDQEMGPLASITPFHEIRKKVQEYKNSKSNETKDAFLELILENVNNKELTSNLLVNKLSPNGSKSPVQDSKITSSEKAELHVNTALNSNSQKIDEKILSPGQIKTNNFVPTTQFQPRPRPTNFVPNYSRPNIVPLTNNFPNQPPRPMMPMAQPNFNPMYRPPFQQFDPMGMPMGVPMGGPMGGPMTGPMPGQMMPNNGFMPNMPPGIMPNMYPQPVMPVVQNNPGIHGIMSKEEYYEYQEKLRKEAELKLRGPYKRSRSRGRYSRSRSRSRSRSPGRYKPNRYRKSRSRSRSRNKSRDRSRERNYRHRSRSRSKSRRKSRERKDSRPRTTRASSRENKSTKESTREKKSDKREDIKIKKIEENVVVTINKSNERQVNTVDEPVEKKKKTDEKERKTKETSIESSLSGSGKESSGSGSKKHKHKHKKSKKKHKRRSSSKN